MPLVGVGMSPDASSAPIGGSRFQSREFLHAFTSHRLVGSMERPDAIRDNAVIEPAFALLQYNVLSRENCGGRGSNYGLRLSRGLSGPITAGLVKQRREV